MNLELANDIALHGNRIIYIQVITDSLNGDPFKKKLCVLATDQQVSQSTLARTNNQLFWQCYHK